MCAAQMAANPAELLLILQAFNAQYGFDWTPQSFEHLPMCRSFVTAKWKKGDHNKKTDTPQTMRVTRKNRFWNIRESERK
jgi:hypothetical protein